MRVLVHAGMCEPSLSRRGVMRLRELGWKWAFNPNDDPDGTMILKGELTYVKNVSTDDSTFLDSWPETHSYTRHDPMLIQVFDELGQSMFSNNGFTDMVHALEIPDGTQYEIYQCEDSLESIHERHRIWVPPGD